MLGVSNWVDEKSLKRAYGRLIREHRPDKDPVGFQRIQEAYERALRIRRNLNWRTEAESRELPRGNPRLEGGTLPLAAPQGPTTSAPEPEETPPLAPAPAPESEETPPLAPAPEPEGTPPEASAVEPLAGESSRAAPSYEAEVGALGPEFSLADLCERHARSSVAESLNEAVQELTLGGHAEHFARELLSEPGRHLLVTEPRAEFAVLFCAGALAYEAPSTAAALLDLTDPQNDEWIWLEDRVQLALNYSDRVTQAIERGLDPVLRRLLVFLPLVDRPQERKLLEDVLLFARGDAERFALQLALLPEELVRALAETSVESVEDETPPGSIPTALRALLEGLNRDLDRDKSNWVWTMSIIFILLASVFLGWRWGWMVGVGTVVGLVLFGAFFQNSMDGRLYRVYLRTPLLTYCLQSGCAPPVLVRFMKEVGGEIARFDSELEEDGAVLLAHSMVRGARARRGALS